eukprot:GDKJ01041228.1.p1 GENE.GDKJ01041228.1~~GDKJ01041228.1.p1  ORF type:complete len:456 (+),score=96.51 GDKJ01041228.1:179-1369(+)
MIQPSENDIEDYQIQQNENSSQEQNISGDISSNFPPHPQPGDASSLVMSTADRNFQQFPPNHPRASNPEASNLLTVPPQLTSRKQIDLNQNWGDSARSALNESILTETPVDKRASIDLHSNTIKATLRVFLEDLVRSNSSPYSPNMDFAPSTSGISSSEMSVMWAGVRVTDLCLIVLFPTDDTSRARSEKDRQMFFDDILDAGDSGTLLLEREFSRSILQSTAAIVSPRCFGATTANGKEEAGLLFASGGRLTSPSKFDGSVSPSGSSTSHFKPLGDVVFEVWDTSRKVCLGATRPKLFRPTEQSELCDVLAYFSEEDLEEGSPRVRRWTPRICVGRLRFTIEIHSAPAAYFDFVESMGPSFEKRRHSDGSLMFGLTGDEKESNPYGMTKNSGFRD